MTLFDLMRSYSTDEKCRALLEKLRWPHGPTCPRCQNQSITRENGKLFRCHKCPYQFTVTTGTIFGDSHLALEKWFAAVVLICEARKGMSANQVKRTLGVSYKTAWYLCHRIRAAMASAERPPLTGKVEMDETYVGGVKRGGKRGRGAQKEIVVGIRQRNGELRFFHAEDVKSGTLSRYVKDHISTDVDVIVTDDSSSYPRAIESDPLFADHRGKHKTVKHSDGVYVDGDIHTNTVENAFSLLKRGIIGTWHKLSAKHLSAYLAEIEFRFNRRHRPDLFLDTLRHMLTTPTLTFQQLTSEF